VELIEGDLRSYERVHNAVRGCEVVFHQGALPSVPRSVQDPITTSEINVGGTLNVLSRLGTRV
jgi:nucleoside-diphosphate-sugar epimerase